MEVGPRRLGQILVEANVLGQAELDCALYEQRRTGGKLGEILLQLRLITEDQLTDALAEQLNLAAIRLSPVPAVPPEVLARIPAALAHASLVLPIEYREEERTLILATADILKGQKLEELRQSARCWIVPRLASRTPLVRAIANLYGPADAARSPKASSRSPEPLRSVKPVSPGERRADADIHPLEPRLKIEHPEVRALVKLLLERGLLTAAEVHAHFREHVSPNLTQQAEVD